jgi:hypothetical protein
MAKAHIAMGYSSTKPGYHNIATKLMKGFKENV